MYYRNGAPPKGAPLGAVSEVFVMDLVSVSHGCGQNSFHFVWKPKYAYRILIDEVKSCCEKVLRQIAQDYGYLIHALEVMPDHVHVFLSFKPSVSVSDVFHKLKGISARRLFEAFPQLRKRYWGGHLWSCGKFFRSVGSTTDRAVKLYIECSQGGWHKAEPQQEQDPNQTQITRFF
jgi:putative transposase